MKHYWKTLNFVEKHAEVKKKEDPPFFAGIKLTRNLIVTIQDLIKDYNELRVGLQKLIHELERYENDPEDIPENDRFIEVMSQFRDTAIEKFDQLEVRYTSMDIAYKDVVTYFGENPRDMKPDEFFGVFKTFTSSWEVGFLLRDVHLQLLNFLNSVHAQISLHNGKRWSN